HPDRDGRRPARRAPHVRAHVRAPAGVRRTRPLGGAMTATFHLAVELDARVTPERFRAAFPEPRAGAFVLEGGGADARLDRASFMGAEPAVTFRARRAGARDGLGRVLADVAIERAGGRR